NRQAAAHDLRETQGGYYPTVDLSGNLGREHTDIEAFKDTGDRSKSLSHRELGLSMSLMLYDGKATTSEVNRRGALLAAAGSRINGTRETVAFRAVEAYLDVLENQRLVELAQENVNSHRQTMRKVRLKAERGVSQRADVEQARGRLALAQSVLVAREGKLREAEIEYQRVIGETPGELLEPERHSLNLSSDTGINMDSLQQAISTATQTALVESPALQMAGREVDAAKDAVSGAKAAYLPRVDLEVTVNKDDNIAGVAGDRDSEAIMLVARWNVYRGGSDKAREKALVERHFAAKDTALDTRRDVEAGVAIAL
ncbi:MAG: TolC family protein, partial [Gammaproteobacteria bacterium]|nr:TolC family protein [Gammaproteobacteria bacterium]